MRVRGQNGAALLEIPLRGNVLLDEYNFKHYNRRRLNPKMIICRMPNDSQLNLGPYLRDGWMDIRLRY